MPKVETTWKLDVDAATGRAKFAVEYHSDLPPAQHERIHMALRRQAEDALRKLGIENSEWERVCLLTITNTESRVQTIHEVRVRTEQS